MNKAPGRVQTETLGTIAKAMADRLRWLQEEGLATFRKLETGDSSSALLPGLTRDSADDLADDLSPVPVGGTGAGLPQVVSSPLVEAVSGAREAPLAALSLEAVREALGDCQRCKLSPTRTHIVFGTGDPHATLMFVGEGPGQEEDRQGKPFVGRAGELLTKMITAMGLSRETVYIANIIKCRPPNNRNPQSDEIAACRPFLDQQIAAIRPQVICALGTFAAQTLLQSESRISDLRGRFHDLKGLKVLPTFHPAYLLRSPDKKKTAWEDLQLIMAELGLPLRGRG